MIALNDSRKKTLLKWLKNGKANINETPEILNDLSYFDKLQLNTVGGIIDLNRDRKIILLRCLINGKIDASDISKVFELATFLELLIESEMIDDD